MPKNIFWPFIDWSSLYATGVTRVQGCFTTNGGRGLFRSRDKDVGNIIRSAIAENPLPYANFTVLSSTEPKLLPIEVFALWEWGISCIYAKNYGKYNIFHSCCKIDEDNADTHFLVHCRLF